jgi:KDO2-lipid IV(A) lauroyltransferase
MWALYAFSGFVYFLAYYIVRHRHQVIADQLAKVFPTKTAAERNAIHRRYLKNFCDVLVEVLKSVSMSPEDMVAHVQIRNIEEARKYLDAGSR